MTFRRQPSGLTRLQAALAVTTLLVLAGCQSTTPEDSQTPQEQSSGAGVPAGTALQPSESVTITQPDTVIDGLDITGSVTIRAENVVVRNSRITGPGYYGVQVQSGSVTISDSEIRGFHNAIAVVDVGRWTGSRLNIHSVTEDGLKMGSDSLLEDSWLHDFSPEPGAHADGIQISDAASNVTIRNNNIDIGVGPERNAAIFIKPELGTKKVGRGMLIEGNYLSGGGYTLYALQTSRRIDDITIRDNTFSGKYGYGTHSVDTPVTWEDNTVAGAPLPL